MKEKKDINIAIGMNIKKENEKKQVLHKRNFQSLLALELKVYLPLHAEQKSILASSSMQKPMQNCFILPSTRGVPAMRKFCI